DAYREPSPGTAAAAGAVRYREAVRVRSRVQGALLWPDLENGARRTEGQGLPGGDEPPGAEHQAADVGRILPAHYAGAGGPRDAHAPGRGQGLLLRLRGHPPAMDHPPDPTGEGRVRGGEGGGPGVLHHARGGERGREALERAHSGGAEEGRCRGREAPEGD